MDSISTVQYIWTHQAKEVIGKSCNQLTHLDKSGTNITDGENIFCIPPTLNGWVYIEPIHGPLDGPLYTWAQYTPTPPRSMNYRHSGVQDRTTRKPTLPRSLNNRRSGVQDWTRREYKGLTPPATTISHRLR